MSKRKGGHTEVEEHRRGRQADPFGTTCAGPLKRNVRMLYFDKANTMQAIPSRLQHQGSIKDAAAWTELAVATHIAFPTHNHVEARSLRLHITARLVSSLSIFRHALIKNIEAH